MVKLQKEIMDLPNVKIKNFKELFQQNQDVILDDSKLITVKAGTRFISVNEVVDEIWVLLSGQVKALEEFATGEVYAFKKFPAPEVFGEMEVLANINEFRATLITEVDSVFLVIPIGDYKKILKNNSKYLYKRTNIIINRVLKEQRHMRMLLMIKSIDRIKIYLVQHYDLYSRNNICILRITRQQIAEETGYAVKTINRVMKRLEEEKLLEIVGQKIKITKPQYIKMFKDVENYVNYTM